MDKIRDLKTMYLLKIKSLRHPICKTPLGELDLNITEETQAYYFTLDAVPVDKDTNKNLLKLYGIS